VNIPLTQDFALAERASYLGGKRATTVGQLDEKFGRGNWTIGYILDGKAISRDEALQLYERSYEAFLRSNPAITNRLITEASDIYDTAPSNVASGLDYHKQEDVRSHLQDIAIRRSLKNMGLAFQGDKLMQVRDVGSDFPELSPGKVPFILPESSIRSARIYGADWVQRGSVEDFWQNNKFVFVKKEGSLTERLRFQLDQKLVEGDKNDRQEIEGTLRNLILLGDAAADLTERYGGFLESHGLRTIQLGEGPKHTLYLFASDIMEDISNAASSQAWGSEQALRVMNSLAPAFGRVPSKDQGMAIITSIDQEICPLLDPAILCAYLNNVERGQWATRGNISCIPSFPGVLETIETDPNYRNYLKTVAIIGKSPEEIREIVKPPTMIAKYHERAERFISLLLDIKKEVEQG
jgi:hypothetical protein